MSNSLVSLGFALFFFPAGIQLIHYCKDELVFPCAYFIWLSRNYNRIDGLLLCLFVYIFCFFLAVIAQGINAGDIKKLQDAGIYTCNGLMMHTKKVQRFLIQVI